MKTPQEGSVLVTRFVHPNEGAVRNGASPDVALDHKIGVECERDRLRRIEEAQRDASKGQVKRALEKGST
ncbi:hypothetical protein HYW83_00825 [Candidatus Peregrinibacteria bacterium]|nr:hypothetical protein [Candidatus Peregrinibacteria bacterium]